MEGSGHTVLYAEEGGQALVHIRCCPVDCVIIDSSVDGVDRVRSFVDALEAEEHAPPIVLVSSSPAAPTFSAKLGAAAFLPKPFEAVELGNVLDRMTPSMRVSAQL